MLTEVWTRELRTAAAALYTDQCDIWRAQEVTSGGATKVVFVCVQQGLPCRLSRAASRKDMLNQALPELQTENEGRLYCAPQQDIRAGDRIDLHRADSTWNRRFTAGDVFLYPSHMEIPLLRKEEA